MNQLLNAGIGNVKPIRDIVYENLRKAILEGKIQPEERIVEKEYAEKLNISRTPIREALRKLEIEGFVEYIPRKGVIVKGFSLKDIMEIYEIRKSLESLAAKHAIKNIDEENIKELKNIIQKMDEAERNGNVDQVYEVCNLYHQVILDISQMPRLKAMVSTLQDYLERFRKVTMAKEIRRMEAIKEHKEILQAIIEKDEQKAEAIVSKHIEGSRKVFLANFRVNP